MRSQKWQHFSTRVPPVLWLKRFQSATFNKNGNLMTHFVFEGEGEGEDKEANAVKKGGRIEVSK
jgi:hypothetical protein